MFSENSVTDLISTGVGCIAFAFAASLMNRPMFAAVFTFLGAFATSIAMTKARDGK
jgi:hypothetical protein